MGDSIYVVAMIMIPQEVWDRWVQARILQETTWLKTPGWRVFADIDLSDGVCITELTLTTWNGQLQIDLQGLTLK